MPFTSDIHLPDRQLGLLGSHIYSVKAFCFGRRVCRLPSVVCLSRVISPKLSKIGAKFRRKIGAPSKI